MYPSNWNDRGTFIMMLLLMSILMWIGPTLEAL
jgi:hypothetical protein